MRLTIISLMEGFPWGGSEELWYQVAKRALQNQVDVQICLKYWENVPQKVMQLKDEGAFILYRTVIPERFYNRGLSKFGLRTSRTYFDNIRDFAPDFILISQGGTFDFFQNAALFNNIRELKTPYSLISQFNTENGGILREAETKRIISSSDWHKFYFVSQRNLESAERQAAHSIARTHIVDNPVNLRDTTVCPWPDTDILRMACVARYDCDFKGQDILLHALASPTIKSRNFHINFFGSGPHGEYLNKAINHYGLQEKACIAGHSESIDEIWASHHIQILPSLAEGTPLSIIECMYKGRPALATDVGDCFKLVILGKTGFLCPSATKNNLIITLRELLDVPLNSLKQMGISASEHVRRIISANPEEVIYDDIISASK